MFRITFATEQKINLIKIIREITGLGLRDAKHMVELGAITEACQIEPFLRAVSRAVSEYNYNAGTKSLTYTTGIELWANIAPVPVPSSFSTATNY